MGIQVPLLVIDRRRVSVMSTLFSNRRGVRSPGCDHGRDEESRNGRDIKIDILEAYVWTPESLRVKLGILPEYRGGYRNPPGGQWDLMGLSGKERKGPKCWPHLPPFPSPIRI